MYSHIQHKAKRYLLTAGNANDDGKGKVNTPRVHILYTAYICLRNEGLL